MELIKTYQDGSDDEDIAEIVNASGPTSVVRVCAAPAILLPNKKRLSSGEMSLLNLPAEQMCAPTLGPSFPTSSFTTMRKAGAGYIESTSISDFSFSEQFQSFQSRGYAQDLATNEVLGQFVQASTGGTRRSNQAVSLSKLDRVADSDIGDISCGPWAKITGDESNNIEPMELIADCTSANLPTGAASSGGEIESAEGNVHVLEPEEDDEKWEKVNERKISHLLPPRQARGSQVPEASSVFHGEALHDYQGRSWNVPPSGTRADDGDHECFIPKKCIKKYTGHTKGVQAIEVFPGTGHLLLSAGMDGKCKVWDVLTDRNVRRTYSGHSEGVRSICLDSNADKFLSSGFDRIIRLWNIETGQAAGTFTNRKMGYQVKFHPVDDNIFLMAASDNKIYQWDARSGQVCQEYNYHLQPCNTVTFIDGGRKFVSTSDDKKVLVWEYDIPVPIKYIAEPDMHSIPSITMHPSGEFFAGQSMDNTIVVYSCGDKVRQIKKKTFKGHNNSGYACQIGFSPNGKFLISGDGMGKLFVWDWKSCKMYRKFQAHEGGPTVGAVWHPLLPSYVFTCGWDGLIKLWD